MLAVADERLEAVLQEVAAARIPAAVVFGGIPTPGDGAALADRLYVSGYPLQERAEAGGIAVVSHSGSSFSALANSGRGLRFSYLISPGQELQRRAQIVAFRACEASRLMGHGSA